MPAQDLSPEYIREIQGLCRARLLVLDELVVAHQLQTWAIQINGVVAAADFAPCIKVLSESLMGAHMLFEILPEPFNHNHEEPTERGDPIRYICEQMIRSAELELRIASYPAATAARADREVRQLVLRQKHWVLGFLAEVKAQWLQPAMVHHAPGWHNLAPNADVTQPTLIRADEVPAGFRLDSWIGALEGHDEALPPYEGPEQGPPDYNASCDEEQGRSA